MDAASPATTGIAANPQPEVESDIPDPFVLADVGDDDEVEVESEWDWQYSDEPPPAGTPLEYAAAYYCRHGLTVVPLVGKNPAAFGDDWWTRAIDEPLDALVVCSDSRYTNLGWAQGYGTVAVDVDNAAKLTDEVRVVIDTGACNPTRPGRGHRVFATDELHGASTAGFPCSGWGEVRAHGGQIVIWGPHPAAPGEHYRYDPRQAVPPAPEELLGWLRPRGDYENAATDDEVEEFILGHTDETRPSAIGIILGKATDRIDAGESIHETTAKHVAPWMFRDVRAGFYSGATALEHLKDWWDRRWEARAGHPANADGEPQRTRPTNRELAGIMSWSVAQAMTAGDDQLDRIRERAGGDNATDGLLLPAAFWSERPVLSHVAAAARSRMCPPDAVLAVVLARVAALTSHTVELPPIVGGSVGLSLIAGLVGPPGSGKSASTATGRDLIAAPTGLLLADGLPLGSGEGLAEVMFEMVDEVDPSTGKRTRVRRQTRHNAFVVVDEGSLLAELAGRQGNTTMSTLRTVFSHGCIGATNASPERRRVLDGDHYVYGVVVGIQPALTGPLFEEASIGAGTPQRFLWTWTIDPSVTADPAPWPGPIDWTPPDPGRLAPLRDVNSRGMVRHQLPVPDHIAAEVRQSIHATRIDPDADAVDMHQELVRLKVAAVLGILDGRVDISDDDWRLAGTVVTASRNVRRYVMGTLRAVEQRSEQARTERYIAREAASEDAALTRALGNASRAVGRKVRRVGVANRGELTRAIASRDRQLVTVDEAIARAESDGFITSTEAGWKPGRVTP